MFFLIVIYSFLFDGLQCQKSNQAEHFEGKITFKKENLVDTVQLTYFIKGNLIKAEFLDAQGEITKYKIFDTQTGEIKTVSPSRQLYKQELYIKKTLPDKASFEVKKTDNYKEINGERCDQWLVKNKQNNALVTYWVTKDEYFNYAELQAMMENTEKTSTYFLLIPDCKNFFPIESTERSILWEQRMSVFVVDIKKMKLNDKIFEVPKNYQIFE